MNEKSLSSQRELLNAVIGKKIHSVRIDFISELPLSAFNFHSPSGPVSIQFEDNHILQFRPHFRNCFLLVGPYEPYSEDDLSMGQQAYQIRLDDEEKGDRGLAEVLIGYKILSFDIIVFNATEISEYESLYQIAPKQAQNYKFTREVGILLNLSNRAIIAIGTKISQSLYSLDIFPADQLHDGLKKHLTIHPL